MIQRRPDRFDVALVMAPGRDRELTGERIRRSFAEQFGESTETVVSFVDELPRTAGGKVRPVISLVTGRPDPARRELPVRPRP